MTTTCYVAHDCIYLQSSGRAGEALKQDGASNGKRRRKRGSIAETMGKGLWIGKRLATHRSYKKARETGEGHAKGREWGWGK